jgi:hypothetical protein
VNEFEEENEAPPSALRGMIDEVRASGPSVDWDRLEAKLFDADDNVRAPGRAISTPSKKNRYAAIGVGLALAAAFAIAVISPTRAIDSNKAPPVAAAARPALVSEDGHTIAAGEKIVAANGTWIRSANRIAVRLEPGTIATVLDVGERVHLALETGAVSADVVPVAGGEPFAVDVSGKRVAVHGTRLRVALLADSIEVAVSEGSAVVGAPRGAGRTEGTIVAAGSIGHFGSIIHVAPNKELATRLVEDALAAKTSAPAIATTVAVIHEPPSAPTTHAPIAHPTVVAVKPTVAAVEPNVAAPAVTETVTEAPKPLPGLSSEQMTTPFAKLDAALAKCARKCPANVICQYEQTLTIAVDPAGKATLVAADPGLDSADRVCWSGVLAGVAFPSAPGSTTAKHHVVLGGK